MQIVGGIELKGVLCSASRKVYKTTNWLLWKFNRHFSNNTLLCQVSNTLCIIKHKDIHTIVSYKDV